MAVVIAAAAAVAAFPVGRASAAPGAAAARLAVTLGDSATFIPGRPAPVRLEIQSDRLISGQLVVTAGTFQLVEPVEVAGGSSKQFEVVVPTSFGQASLQAQVAVTEGRAVLASAVSAASAAPDTEVVGVMPDLLVGRALPGPTPLSVDAGTARFVSVSDQDLALAPASLGPLTAVALGPDALARLSPAVRQALLAWTAAGGRLLIDAQPGDTVGGLPVAWQSTGASRTSAGIGQVVLTSGAMTAGRWDGLIDPAGHVVGVAVPSGFGAASLLSTALATDAGIKSPRLPALIGFLLLYIVLVGPVSFIVLRRRRRPELLWVVIPILSLVFAGTGYAVGAAGRSLRVVHGTIVDTTVAGGTALSYVGVLSGGQGTLRLDAPTGWVVQRYTDPQNPPPSATTVQLKVAPTSRGIEGSVGLDAGQFAVVNAAGPAGFSGQLAVTARSTANGGAEGTVTNRTAYALQDVSVLVGAEGVDVGTMAAGAQKSWALRGGAASGSGLSVENQLWGNSSLSFGSGNGDCVGPGAPLGFGGLPTCGASSTASGATASLPVWSAGPAGLAPGTRSGGMAVAVGWTSSYSPPVSVAGHGPPSKGRTAIVGTAPVEAVAPVADLAIWRQIVRGNLIQVAPGTFIDTTNSGLRTAVTWVLPPAAAGHQLSLAIPSGAGEVDVWSQGAWRKLTDAPAAATTSNGGPPVFIPPVGGQPPGAVPIPFPVPTTVPFGSSGGGSTASTTVTLGAADVDNGAVYVRLGGVGINEPVNLDALGLSVLP